jgi:hypothetical protein
MSSIDDGHSTKQGKTRREQIAIFLEGQKWFREYDEDGAPKLDKVKIAGPYPLGEKNGKAIA